MLLVFLAAMLHGSHTLTAAQVIFRDIADTANPHDVAAHFIVPGSYQLELLVSDELLTSTRTATVTVLPEPAPPVPNIAPLFSLGPDFIAVAKTVLLFPSVLEDGKSGGNLTATWDYDRGPAALRFDFPAGASGPQASIGFPLPGIYEIRLTVSDGVLSSTDTVSVDVPASLFGPGNGLNAAPMFGMIRGLVWQARETA